MLRPPTLSTRPSKTLRLTFAQFDQDSSSNAEYLGLARKIQFVDCLNHLIFRMNPEIVVRRAAEKALQLPRIVAVTILSDCLAYNPNCPYVTNDGPVPSMTVRQFVEETRLEGLICTDVSQYTIRGGKFSGLRISNTKLTRMWPSVKDTPEGFDAMEEIKKCYRDIDMLGFDQNRLALASRTSFPIWVGFCERVVEARSRYDESPWPAGMATFTTTDDEVEYCFIKSSREVPLRTPDGRAIYLHTLSPESDPRILEWASELLAINIETFTYIRGQRGWHEMEQDTVAYWTELEGGESMAQRTSVMYKLAMGSSLIALPCQPNQGIIVFHVVAMLCDATTDFGQLVDSVFGHDNVEVCHLETLRQIFYIMIAAGLLVMHEQDLEEEVAEWSGTLIKKYLIAAGKAEEEVEGMDAMSLRGVFTTAMHISRPSDRLEMMQPVVEPDGLAQEELHSGFVDWLKSAFRKCDLLQMYYDNAVVATTE